MEKKLEVKNLVISFRTSNGKVQAVRDISFDLYKGETLAIVGESGSGKSVTSRAIMGILAGNAMVEGGKILFGDKDLLKISEEDFHKIRGDKIAMVFQDPLSSLNPIMKIGPQLTEAMLLKNKASRKESGACLKGMFKTLEQMMTGAGCSNAGKDIESFTEFELRHCQLQKDYNDALSAANETLELAKHVVLSIKGKVFTGLKVDISTLVASAKKSCSYFVVRDRALELHQAADTLSKIVSSEKGTEYPQTLKRLETLISIETEALSFDVPDLFNLGYYLTFVDKNIPQIPVKQLNELVLEKTDSGFMSDFIRKATKGVEYSCRLTDDARREAIALLNQMKIVFTDEPTYKTALECTKQMKEAVKKCIDPLEVVKDSLTHTFGSSIDYDINLYYTGEKRNTRESVRFARESAKHQAIVNKGKVPEWEVIPASYVDLALVKQDIVDTISELSDHFSSQIEENSNADFVSRTLEVISYLKSTAQDSVNVLSSGAAKEKAIKLMESVGIDNPRQRFKQYPFEFSGGMRQRIVIAIALTANPEVLICDEPTTALDVTIQSQILELINDLKKQRDLSVIFITHDLGVVANMADRIAVMYAGKIVEYGTSMDVFYNPAHPYTWALLSSVPDLDTKEKLESIPGTPPNMIYPPKGDAFAPRNKYALEIDFEEQPPMFRISDTHYAATWLLHPEAPEIKPPAVVMERINRMKEKN